jgi:hypothetical protein
MSKELDEILKKLRGEDQVEKPHGLPRSMKAEGKGIKLHTFDVPREAIYDKLRDGSYSAKYENYLGATGNEERLAQQQSFGEKAIRGIQKFGGKTINNALDATIGTAYGLVQGIADGSWSAVWDNDFSNYLDDANKKMNNRLAHYYTEEEKNKNFIQSLGTANFWFNDVGDGLAFVTGALLPEVALGLATGGASLGVGLGKTFARMGARKLGRETVELGAKKFGDDLAGASITGTKKVTQFEKAADIKAGVDETKNYYRSILGKKIGDPLSTAGFLFRTSHFEAGMEARHNFHDSMDKFLQTFEEKNGREPSIEEISKFTNEAKSAANYLYGANLAILSVSNAAMFGKAFNLKVPKIKSLDNQFNKLIGLGVSKADDGLMVMQKANKLQKIAGRSYKLLGRSATEGLYEEGFQGVAGKNMQMYLDTKYDPNANSAETMFTNLSDAFAQQYGTKEGWKEMGIGMVIGMMGGAVQPFNIDESGKMKFTAPSVPGFGSNSYKAARLGIEKDVEKVNNGIISLKGMTSASAVQNFKNMSESGAGEYFSTAAENTIGNIEFIKSQEHLKSKKDILKDYEVTIDSLVLDEEFTDEQAAQYKDSLKQEFKQNLEDYNFAVKAVESLGLDRKIKKTPGDIDNIAEALTMNIVLGKNAVGSAQNIAKQIDTIINPSVYAKDEKTVISAGTGIYDSMKHYAGLGAETMQKVKELSKKQKELQKLQDRSVTLQGELQKEQANRKGKSKDVTIENRFNTVSEKALTATQRIIELEGEIETLESAINSEFNGNEYDIDGTVSSNPTNIRQTLAEIEKLEKYINSLKLSGKTREASELEYLVKQFQFQVDSHREMVNTHRDMFDTNFFTSDKGKTLIDRIVGQPYTMSEEFKEALRDNSEVVDRSLGLVGIRGYDKVESVVEQFLEQNPNLSQRDKHRLEALLRLQLNMEAVNKRIESIQALGVKEVIEEETSSDPIKGDTLVLEQNLEIKEKDLSNLKELDTIINSILAELSKVRQQSTTKQKKIEILKNLDDAKKRKKDLELTDDKQDIDNPYYNLKTEEEVDAKIEEIKKQQESSKTEYNYVDSPEYKRLIELMVKLDNDDLSTAESRELDELKKDVDDWLLITGTVVEGFRLSDLIRQKVVLENTAINKVEDVGEVTDKEVIESIEFVEKPAYVDYSLGQTYDAATAIAKGNEIHISGIKPDEFFTNVGFKTPYKTNKEGHIILDKDAVDQINTDSEVIRIGETSGKLSTNYNVVPMFYKDINGEWRGTYLGTNYSTDYPEGGMDIDAIYALNGGEEVSLVVDARDLHNVDLMAEYKKAKTDEAKAAVMDKIKAELSVKVFVGSKFISVLKASRENALLSEANLKFEAFRVSLAEQVMENLIKGVEVTTLVHDKITVSQVLIGHPNFSFSRGEGEFSTSYREMTDQDAVEVEDIGYVEEGKLQTHKKVTGINTTFLGKTIDSKSKTKKPFIVVSRGGIRFAIPVKVKPNQKPSNKDIEEIFNNKNISDSQKAMLLNKKLAERGIDIKKVGDSFISFGKTSNLTREFFDQKLAQLDNIEYFRPLNEWLDTKNSMQDILKNQVLINVDLSKPVHSPKVRLDFSDVFANVDIDTSQVKPTNSKNPASKTGKGSSAYAQYSQTNMNNSTNNTKDNNNCPT